MRRFQFWQLLKLVDAGELGVNFSHFGLREKVVNGSLQWAQEKDGRWGWHSRLILTNLSFSSCTKWFRSATPHTLLSEADQNCQHQGWGKLKAAASPEPPSPHPRLSETEETEKEVNPNKFFYYHRLSLSSSKEGGGWEEVCNRQKQSFAFWNEASSLWRPCWRGTWTWTSSSRTRWTRWTRWTPSFPPCQGAAQENGRLGKAQRPVSSTTANVHLHSLLNDIYYFTSNCSFTSSCTSSCTNNNIFTCLRVATFTSGNPQPRWMGQVQGRELDPRDSGVHDQSFPWGLGGPVGELRTSCPDSVSGGRTSDDATYIE